MSGLVKFAATESPLVPMAMEHVVFVPEQEPSPPHCLNFHPALAPAAVSVTVVPWAKEAEQVPGQEMPAGLLTTVPLASSGNGDGEIVTEIWLAGGGGGGGGAAVVKAAVSASVPLAAKLHVGAGDEVAALFS